MLTLKNFNRKILYCGGTHIVAGKFDSAFCHRNTGAGINNRVINQEMELIANDNHLKINAVSCTVIIFVEDQLPLVPA